MLKLNYILLSSKKEPLATNLIYLILYILLLKLVNFKILI